MDKKNSEGIMILGQFLLLCVIPSIMVAFMGLMAGPSQNKDVLGKLLDAFIPTMFILCPFIFLIAGMGIMKFKNWARIFIIIFCLINTLLVIVYFMHIYIVLKTSLDIRYDLIWILIGVFSLCIIYYLTRSKVKEKFK